MLVNYEAEWWSLYYLVVRAEKLFRILFQCRTYLAHICHSQLIDKAIIFRLFIGAIPEFITSYTSLILYFCINPSFDSKGMILTYSQIIRLFIFIESHKECCSSNPSKTSSSSLLEDHQDPN